MIIPGGHIGDQRPEDIEWRAMADFLFEHDILLDLSERHVPRPLDHHLHTLPQRVRLELSQRDQFLKLRPVVRVRETAGPHPVAKAKRYAVCSGYVQQPVVVIAAGEFGPWQRMVEEHEHRPAGPHLCQVLLEPDNLLLAHRRPRVLYLVGESPFVTRPDCDYLIAQDIYLPPFEVDAFLPAASFSEAEGTLTNIEGRVQTLARVEAFPDSASAGFVRPDWRIFSDLAARLDRPDLEYPSSAAVLEMIHAEVPGFPRAADRQPRRPSIEIAAKVGDATAVVGALQADEPAASPPPQSGDELLLVIEHAGFRHRGIDLAGVVEGLAELGLEQALRMNADDMERLGIVSGGTATVSFDGISVALAAKPDEDCPTGAAYFVHAEAFGGLPDRARLEPLYRLPAGSMKVHVRAGV
jgi:hypothetical protein